MLQINLFGPFRLRYQAQPLKFAALPKSLLLLVDLLLNRAKPIPRTTLAFTHWPDCSEAEARSNLRRHLYELRRVLPATDAARPWLLVDNNTVQWNPEADYWCDVVAFEEAGETLPALAEAVQLYTSDLLPELYEDWSFGVRERLRNRFFAMLGQLLTHAQRAGDYPTAIGYAQQILQHDPQREDVVRELMTLRHASGDRAGALQEYQRFAQRLRTELDIAPMVETSALYDHLARQTASPAPVTAPTPPPLATPPPPLPTQPESEGQSPHNLAAQLTSFIGREAEVAGIRALLTRRESTTRLLTLTGPGGSGKTRLALEVGMRLVNQQPAAFTHGIYLVHLAAVSDPALVLPTIATTLGVKEQGHTPLIEALKGWLRAKTILLILDNFEQITTAAADLTELLQAAPHLTLLVTSRKLLSIYGEHEFPVSPLPLPDPDEWRQPERLAQSAAVNLFITRSRAINPTFTLTRENAAAVAEVCTRLDGLPLALELAAARSKLFTPSALLAKLTRGLDLLVGAQHGLAARQRTLRQTIDWSYHLLDPVAKQLFARLGIFVGEFTLAAAEAVAPATAQERETVLEELLDLLNQSMVQRVEPATPDDPTLRFRLLLTLRDYALEQLQASGEARAIQERHARYYLAQMEQAASTQELANEGYWLDQMAAELDNLRAAFAWARQPDGHPEIAMRLATATASFWLKRGYLAEGRRWLEQALANTQAISPDVEAKAYSAIGTLVWYQEDYQAAQAYLQRSLALWQTLGDAANQAEMARIYLSLGGIARQHDNYAAAVQYHTAALAIQRQLDNKQGMADALHNLGVAETFLGHYEAAQQRFAECYAIDCTLGDQWGMFLDLNSWGVLSYLQGDYAAARSRLTEGLAIARRLGAKTRLALLLTHVGKVSLAEERWSEAQRYFHEALTIANEVGIKSQRFGAHIGLALIRLQQEEDAAAFEHLTHCLTIWRADRKPKELLSLLDALALYWVRQPAPQPAQTLKAVQLLGFAQALRAQQQLPPREAIYQPLYQKALTFAHQRLTPEQFATAQADGGQQTPETIVALVDSAAG